MIYEGSTTTEWFFVYLIPGRIGNWKKMDFEERENRSTRRKTSRSKGENQQQTQPIYGVHAGYLNMGHIQRREANALTTAPTLALPV